MTSTGLVVQSEEWIPPKDFQTEIRGYLDIKHLIERAVIRIDEPAWDLQEIIAGLVYDITALVPHKTLDFKQIISELFRSDVKLPQDLHQNDVLAHRMQAWESSTVCRTVRNSWTVLYCSVDGITRRHVGIARLSQPTNLGKDLEELQLIVLVLAPKIDKSTKSALETARSFATLLMDEGLRIELIYACDQQSIKESMHTAAVVRSSSVESRFHLHNDTEHAPYRPFSGLQDDFARRLAAYKSDWTEGRFSDIQSVSKVCSTVFFLLCAILPTSIAYGMLNNGHTTGLINVQKVIVGQAIGGTFFALFGGQPMLILSTTAPLSIYIHVIYNIAQSTDWPFYKLYTCVGLWCSLFLILAAIFQAADLLKFTRRSTEEMFSLFIATALTYEAIRSMIEGECLPQSALLFILLTLLTCWMSVSIDGFRNHTLFSKGLRNLIADYAVPLAMIAAAVIARLLFFNVPKNTFALYDSPDLHLTTFWSLPPSAHILCFLLAAPLAVLFFVDQLLVTKTVDNKQNKLIKGSAHHWDLLVVAVLNIFLSLLCLPWMHAALPSSFLHLRSLADVEERITDGRVQQVITKPREVRVSLLLAHLLIIPVYIFALPLISEYVPNALFHGLFLFMALSSLSTNQFFHRLTLIFTEQRAYPPTSYIRQLPQRVIHAFTIIELLQLIILLVIGLSPLYYVSMLFPLIIAIFVPIRLFVLPKLFKKSHLEVIDGSH